MVYMANQQKVEEATVNVEHGGPSQENVNRPPEQATGEPTESSSIAKFRLQVMDIRHKLMTMPREVQQKVSQEMSIWNSDNGPLQYAIKAVMMKPEFVKSMAREMLASEHVLGTIALMGNKRIDQ